MPSARFQIEALYAYAGVQLVVPRLAHGLERVTVRRLDLDRGRAALHQPRDRGGAGHVLRDANEVARSIQSSMIAARSRSGAIRQLWPWPSSTRMLAPRRQPAHQAGLLHRRHQRVAIGGEVEHRRVERRQPVAQVVVAQDAEARQVPLARGRAHQIVEPANLLPLGSRRVHPARVQRSARSASAATAWRATSGSRATAAPASAKCAKELRITSRSTRSGCASA